MYRLLFLVCLMTFPFQVLAEETTPVEDQEYQELLKKSPFNKMYPKSLAAPAAEYFAKWNTLFTSGPIPSKEARLVAVSASAAMKCEYCITAQVIMAKQAGATDDEIKAAIQIAAEVARFSILLYGNEFGQDNLKAILDKMTKKTDK